MKSAKQNKSTITQFLEPFLKEGNEKKIILARKQYWRIYKANWRKQKRKEHKEFTVSFTNKELHVVTLAAKKHNRSNTRFIKEAALAYCTNKILVPDPLAVNQVRELLTLNYTALQELTEDQTYPKQDNNDLLFKLADLENKILQILKPLP